MARQLTPPGYVLPRPPRWGGGLNLMALFAGSMSFVAAASAATEWVAEKLQNPIELGPAIFWIGNIGYFQPFGALKLWTIYASKRSTPSNVQTVLWEGFAITVFGGLLSGYITYWLFSLFRDQDSMKHNQGLHGSARWAGREEIKQTGMLDATDGVYIGGWRNPKSSYLHYLLHNGPESVLLFAPSRSGKGMSCIIPTLLQWRNSVFVYDLKGENFDLTAGYRQKMGQRVLRFAPSLPYESCCFNPLSEIRFGTNYDVSDATTIAEAVVRNGDDNTLYKHFEDAAVDLVTAGILHLGYSRRLLRCIAALGPHAALKGRPSTLSGHCEEWEGPRTALGEPRLLLLDSEEIAETLGVTYRSVHTYLCKLRQILHKAFNADGKLFQRG